MAGVTVTERATDELRNMLAEASTKEGQVLRLVAQPEGRGFALGTDQVEDGDQVVEEGGEPVLVVSEDLSEALDGAVIDVEETEEGARLTVTR
jgi:Fe-S cluster assembly iron-binding protein IscA